MCISEASQHSIYNQNMNAQSTMWDSIKKITKSNKNSY